MKITQALNNFYIQNNLSIDGGENDNYFDLKFKLFTITLPNSDFRKNVVYIHDIQHVLFDCDVTWKGESYIAGYEIASGMWKHFPIGIMSLWAMGFSLLIYPKEVLKGYKKGLLYNNLLNLDIKKEEVLNLSVNEIDSLLTNKKPSKFNWFLYAFWGLTSISILLFPILVALIAFLIFL